MWPETFLIINVFESISCSIIYNYGYLFSYATEFVSIFMAILNIVSFFTNSPSFQLHMRRIIMIIYTLFTNAKIIIIILCNNDIIIINIIIIIMNNWNGCGTFGCKHPFIMRYKSIFQTLWFNNATYDISDDAFVLVYSSNSFLNEEKLVINHLNLAAIET